jgi:hypothetical protein
LLWWQKELLEMEEKELIQQQPVSNYSYVKVPNEIVVYSFK